MHTTQLDHPTEDELELYILNRSRDEELEGFETHILACNSCVTRLEDLECEIRVTKLALQNMRREQSMTAALPQQNSWKTWLTVPKLSWTSAMATVALALIVAPAFLRNQAPVAQVSLSAFRGDEIFIVPAGYRLEMHLSTADLAEGPVLVEVVDMRGIALWKGSAAVHDTKAEVTIPPITDRGAHFLRLYAATQASPDSDLLREFAFQVE